ncbi:GntR family transcriptional regulator [Alkalihalobacillus hemicellulosilyticus]|uniref:Transcriptional regulator n=1 Tax=Halalkalibacter hemicellulosilyticusJCM 9152 TaxID=1236971 RepID=W4QGP1_9BACI|nr:GntR family transcriptional regulator [Halalkalibacter hemicellulosilyticus]GAE30484.1 transcriptional regulator [Halalkalibacter hemicellulosilyticusJCM 9152]
MSQFHDKKPIFLQIKEKIEDQIFKGQLQEHEQIPSTTQMVHFYKVNHITISKGINLLVDEGIIYKKRGVGMFVAEGAKEQLVEQRKGLFESQYVLPLIEEAEKLDLTEAEINRIIRKVKERERK